MRLCRYDDDRIGIVRGDHIHDATAIAEKVLAARPKLRWGDPLIAALAEIGKALPDVASLPSKPAASVTLLSPIERPSKLVAAPTNYHAHVAEMVARKTGLPPSKPISEAGLFLKANSALVGVGEGVALRFLDRLTEHELEFVIVIGRTCAEVSEAEALDYVAGYTLGLDMTVRGGEERSLRKSLDSYAVLGPWLVTRDEIADPDDIPFKLRVNGAVRHDAHTSDLIWSCRKLISYASTFYTLHPGDVIYTGAPAGVGPVRPGDVMTAECAAIGDFEAHARAFKKA